jgi:hypothetical protein
MGTGGMNLGKDYEKADRKLEADGLSPECPECGKSMAFVKRKDSTKEWPDEDGYSDWKCKNKECSDFGEPIHRLFDNGGCEER